MKRLTKKGKAVLAKLNALIPETGDKINESYVHSLTPEQIDIAMNTYDPRDVCPRLYALLSAYGMA